jgi:TolB protein
MPAFQEFFYSVHVNFRLKTIVLLLVGAYTAPAAHAEDSNSTESTGKMAVAFQKLDSDHDMHLSLQEFLGWQGEPTVLQRDFQLFDVDRNGMLSRREFAAVPGSVDPVHRGKLPDPFDTLVQEAVIALDISYDHWNQRPNETVNAHTFVANFIGSISYGGKRYVTGRIIKQADRDADGKMSRAEAESFLKQQLGLAWTADASLREGSGRVLRYDRFIEIDVDQDDRLIWEEFQKLWWSEATAEQDFNVMDTDDDGTITLAEYASAASNYVDPIEWFRSADTNFDALLDEQELLAATDSDRLNLVASTLPAFDRDHDGFLTLPEYRLSMHANYNYKWNALPVDEDRNGSLSYNEFVFSSVDLFQLQRSFYFHRLDQDGNGELSASEFEFMLQPPYTIHLIGKNQRESRQIHRDPTHPRCGALSIDPDGQRLLFHRFRADQSQAEKAEGRIVVMSLAGGNLRELCDGQQPSWSSDGKEFVCAKQVDNGIWIMAADGLSGKKVAEGTTPKWSPDGTKIAYLHDNGLWVHDLGSGQQTKLLSRQDHTYRELGADIAWSPDGSRVAMLAKHGKLVDLVIVFRASGDLTVRHSFTTRCSDYLSWLSEGIVVAVAEANGRGQFSLVAPNDRSEPSRIPGFGFDQDWNSACLTPDGKWYIAVSLN